MESKFKDKELVMFIEESEGKYANSDKGRIVKIHEQPNKKNKKIIEYFYDVNTSGHIVELVPESHLEHALSSSSKQVDDILSEKEKDKAYKDSDIRVGGSRKEKQAYKDLITGADLEAIEQDPILAKELVKKEKVYPKLIIANEIDKGVSGGTAFLKNKMRESCSPYPPNDRMKRKFYVEFIEYIVSQLSDVTTIEQFNAEINKIYHISLEKLITIIRPEIIDEIKKEIAEIEELKERVKSMDENNEMHELNKYIRNNLDAPYNWQNDEKIIQHLKENNIEEQDKINTYLTYVRLKKIVDAYAWSNVTPLTTSILEELGYTDFNGIRANILTDIFGKRFLKFLRGSDYIDEAKSYDGITQEESKKMIHSATEHYTTRIPKGEEALAYFTSEDYLDKPFAERKAYADKVHDETGYFGWGFYKGNFGVSRPKYLYYDDVNDKPEFFDIWIRKAVSNMTGEIEKQKELVKKAQEKFKPRDNYYGWAEKGKKGSSGERTALVVNSGLPLSYIKRVGGVAVLNTDLEDNDKIKSFFKNVLGITRYEYGNYLPDKERLQHAKHFSGAMLDMAEMLNWDVKQLVGLGDLGIKFASSGKGKAMAHYEPDRVAINLTRGSGDGTIAHESAHYIDNIIATKFPDENETFKRHAVMGSYTSQYGGGRNISNTEIFDAMKNIMQFIKSGTINISGEGSEKIDELKKLHDEYRKSRTYKKEFERNTRTTRYGVNKEAGIEAWEQDQRNINYYLQTEVTAKSKTYLGAVLNEFDIDKYEFTLHMPSNTSVYYAFSSNMGSEYWSWAWELFARGFETYMFDKLAKKNRTNNYLVSGGYFERGENVYPQEIEREILFILYDKYILAIKKALSLKDFTPFREERADEYVSIDVKKDEEQDEIQVDSETDQVIETSNPDIVAVTLEQKLKKLHEILSDNLEDKLARGGLTRDYFNEIVKGI